MITFDYHPSEYARRSARRQAGLRRARRTRAIRIIAVLVGSVALVTIVVALWLLR